MVKLGQNEYLESVVKVVIDKTFEAALPKLMEITAQAAVASEPMIRVVVREEVMPKLTLGLVAGMIGVAGVSALIGSLLARGGSRKGMSGLNGVGEIAVVEEREKAAGNGSSSGQMMEGLRMTQASVHSPPVRAKAANGNIVHELRQSARELADELARKRSSGLAGPYRPGYAPMNRPGYAPMNPSTGLGMARLVNGEVKPGQIVVGAVVGVPVQQLLSKLLLQQVLGAKEMVGDGVTGLGGIVLHLIARSSFTLGLGTSLLLPFVADITDWALREAGVVKMAGLGAARPPQQINRVQPRAPVSVPQLRSFTAPGRRVA